MKALPCGDPSARTSCIDETDDSGLHAHLPGSNVLGDNEASSDDLDGSVRDQYPQGLFMLRLHGKSCSTCEQAYSVRLSP